MDFDFLMPFEFKGGVLSGLGGRQLHPLDRSDCHRRARRSQTDARAVDLEQRSTTPHWPPRLMWQFPQPRFLVCHAWPLSWARQNAWRLQLFKPLSNGAPGNCRSTRRADSPLESTYIMLTGAVKPSMSRV